MAIKITIDAIVKTVQPEKQQFSLDELNNHVDGWVEPLKIGPIWVMYREKSKEDGEPLNQVASFFFDVAIHGTVLVVPPQQMPTEWELMDDIDLRYSSDQVDTGFLSALQAALIQHRVFNSLTDTEMKSMMKNHKEEWAYKPSEELDDDLREFFKRAYKSIVAQQKTDDDTVLFEDENIIVRTLNKEDRLKTIDQMIAYFIEEEEYEKCAALQKLKEPENC